MFRSFACYKLEKINLNFALVNRRKKSRSLESTRVHGERS